MVIMDMLTPFSYKIETSDWNSYSLKRIWKIFPLIIIYQFKWTMSIIICWTGKSEQILNSLLKRSGNSQLKSGNFWICLNGFFETFCLPLIRCEHYFVIIPCDDFFLISSSLDNSSQLTAQPFSGIWILTGSVWMKVSIFLR